MSSMFMCEELVIPLNIVEHLIHSFLKNKGLDKKKDVLSKIMVSMKSGK